MILTILKLLVVLIFLVMFIRRPSIVWGIGLLTVVSAALLDTLLGTLGREQLLAELGFFFYIIAGLILAGAAFWMWGILRPLMPDMNGRSSPIGAVPPIVPENMDRQIKKTEPATENVYFPSDYDRQLLFNRIHDQFGREDISDLIFDLDLNELDILAGAADGTDLVDRVLEAAGKEGKVDELTLAVERIQTPPRADHLPRLEKLTADSPRPVLRYFLLSGYDLDQLAQIAATLDIDWEQLPSNSKRDKVRGLLLYQYNRNDISALLSTLQSPDASAA